MDLWEDQAWFEHASGQAQLARATGTLSLLPYALDYLAGNHIQAGELSVAAGLIAEAEGLEPGIRAQTLPYIPLQLAAWRGDESTALDLIEVMTTGAHARGEGWALTVTEYATAILYNGLGRYGLALDAARRAAAADEIGTSSWALVRAGRGGIADRPAAGRIRRAGSPVRAYQRERHRLGDGDRGALARAREDGETAESSTAKRSSGSAVSHGDAPGSCQAELWRVAAPRKPSG